MAHEPLHAHLPAGQACTLAQKGQTVLRVVEGRLWATCSGTPHDWPGDHFLGPGQSLVLQGARWVVEAMDGRAAHYEVLPATLLAPDRDALGQVHPQREDRRGRQQAARHPGAPVSA